jgi:hypothetical protein
MRPIAVGALLGLAAGILPWPAALALVVLGVALYRATADGDQV